MLPHYVAFAAVLAASYAAAQSTLLSTQMALSGITRDQGIVLNESDTSVWLRAGFTQKAFRAWLDQYPNATESDIIRQHMIRSVDSAAGPLRNVTANLQRSMDRNSNGNAFLEFYREKGNETYQAAVDGLVNTLSVQLRNAQGGLF